MKCHDRYYIIIIESKQIIQELNQLLSKNSTFNITYSRTVSLPYCRTIFESCISEEKQNLPLIYCRKANSKGKNRAKNLW